MNLFIVALCLLTPQQTPPPAGQKAALPDLTKTLQVVQEQIADLTLLQSLTPLKLTPDQIKQILPTLKKARERAIELNRQDDEAIAELAPEVAKARAQALTESVVPDSIEKRISEIQRMASARRLTATRKTVAEVLEAIRDVLTESQKTEIEHQSEKYFGGKRVPKEYSKDPSKAPKSVIQDLAVSAYTERVLLFDRTITLLELIKAAPKPE